MKHTWMRCGLVVSDTLSNYDPHLIIYLLNGRRMDLVWILDVSSTQAWPTLLLGFNAHGISAIAFSLGEIKRWPKRRRDLNRVVFEDYIGRDKRGCEMVRRRSMLVLLSETGKVKPDSRLMTATISMNKTGAYRLLELVRIRLVKRKEY